MALQFKKSISDPLYGTIPLTELELKIIDTPVFQRLRHVQNLGLANYVFPSAIYSRFAHSIGACHTIGQMLERLEAQAPEGARLTDDDFQFWRASMLLHDVGHYFMSHAAESAIQDFFRSKPAADHPATVDTVRVGAEGGAFCDHEEAGKIILNHDPKLEPIVRILDPDQLAAMFKGALDRKYGSLVSSELDADRLDYLMRSAQSTGLPYGHFDREYILESLVTADDGRVCLREKAIRAADHFVLCRSFDYLQVIFHKTIVGFEAMLKRCIRHLLDAGELVLDSASIKSLVQNGSWHTYTDSFLLEKIRAIGDDAPTVVAAMRDRVLNRRPAEMIGRTEELASFKPDAERDWYSKIGWAFNDPNETWAQNCIYWFKQFRTTEASPFRKSYSTSDSDDEAKEKSIQILRRHGSSLPLTDCPESFTRYLSDQAYVMVRIYFVGPDSEREATMKSFAGLVTRNRLDILMP